MRRPWPLIIALGLISWSATGQERGRDFVGDFRELIAEAERGTDLPTLGHIEQTWSDQHVAPLVEILRLHREPHLQAAISELLERRTKAGLGTDINAWFRWIWSRRISPHEDYAAFKGMLYARIDPRFRGYFEHAARREIRLDEIRWGGVVQDGIPPLVQPETLSATEADWIADSDVVFGVVVNGEPRAYPKRILAWHELVRDTIGERPFLGVYCTLCGAMIAYDPVVDGTHHRLGTSGFLHRSNKLMFDEATGSLWSTFEGRPVLGSLVGSGVRLPMLSVVTTTWGAWRARHPATTVLSLDTGHARDYGEGVAYRDYFATDELMFSVREIDGRLRNKDEVLAIRGPRGGEPLAIEVRHLTWHRVHHDGVGGRRIVVLTDSGGAARVYDAPHARIVSYDGNGLARDLAGDRWVVEEEGLRAPDGRWHRRLPHHRAFWFGWRAAWPATRLVRLPEPFRTIGS